MKTLIFIILLIATQAHAQADQVLDSLIDLNNPPVPVEFMGMSVNRSEETITFSWRTASEIDNDYFYFEQSTDAKTWEEIGRITGSGTSKTIQHYSWTCTETRTAYYRLSQIDYDGTTEQLTLVVVPGYDAAKVKYFDMQGRPTTADAPGLKIATSEGKTWKVYYLE